MPAEVGRPLVSWCERPAVLGVFWAVPHFTAPLLSNPETLTVSIQFLTGYTEAPSFGSGNVSFTKLDQAGGPDGQGGTC